MLGEVPVGFAPQPRLYSMYRRSTAASSASTCSGVPSGLASVQLLSLGVFRLAACARRPSDSIADYAMIHAVNLICRGNWICKWCSSPGLLNCHVCLFKSWNGYNRPSWEGGIWLCAKCWSKDSGSHHVLWKEWFLRRVEIYPDVLTLDVESKAALQNQHPSYKWDAVVQNAVADIFFQKSNQNDSQFILNCHWGTGAHSFIGFK